MNLRYSSGMFDISSICDGFNRRNNPLLNRSYSIKVESVNASVKWTPVFIWAMTKREMVDAGIEGQTACFNHCISTNGEPLWGTVASSIGRLSLDYGYDSNTFNVKFEKQKPEPGTNFVMGGGGSFWCKVNDPTLPSDTVTGIQLHNREDPDDAFAHHATLIIWQLQQKESGPVVDIESGYVTVSRSKLIEMKKMIEAMLK
jgi:hypothetical protein